MSRLVIARLPFPQPQFQYDIYDLHGRLAGRLDAYWDELGMFGEVDGRTKYAEPNALWKEKIREDELRDLGLVGTRWGKAEVDQPQLLLAKLQQAQSRALRRDPADRRWRAVPHYPSRRP